MLPLAPLLAGLAHGAEVPANAGERAKTLATAFVATHGPRQAGTPAAERAQRDVAGALKARAWQPRALHTFPGAVYACQPGLSERVLLVMAHTDTVGGTDGGNDNASSVGVLLTAAELLRGVRTPRTVCLAFPDSEEDGLRGSEALALGSDRGLLGGPVDQALSLDLVGVGTLTHVGLGPTWGHAQLASFLGAAPAAAPWVHRGIAVLRPDMERSDHYWFTERGIPASQLYGRGTGGVDWAYHSPADTVDRLETDTLQGAVEAVVGAALAPPLGAEAPDEAAVVLPFTSTVLPGWLTWWVLALAPVGWLAGFVRPRIPPREALHGSVAWAAHAIVATTALGLAMQAALGFRRLDLALAGPALTAAWAAWAAVAVGAPLETPPPIRRGLGGLAALGLAAGMLWAGSPLLALPFAVAASAVGLTRWVPAAGLLAAWPAAYLFRPDAVRELHFHHLFPAHPGWWTAVGGIALLPLLGALPEATPQRRKRLAAVLVIIAIGAVIAAWLTPEQLAPFIDWTPNAR